MRGLTALVVAADPVRLAAALRLAATAAALGGRARVFLDEAAVPLAVALPAEPMEVAHALGVAVILCQTGLAAAGLALPALDPRLAAGGLAGLLAELGEDRLVVL